MANIHQALPGTVAWVDLQTPDLGKAREFYGELLGWSFAGGDDPNTGFYTMAQIDGRNAAGLGKLSEQAPLPPMWSVYFATDDVDDTARKVSEAGGKVVMPPMDVMEEGRMAFFVDPTGAHFGAWQGKRHRGAQVVDEPGAMVWHEVYTRDVKAAREFYMRVFGLETKRLDTPAVEYWTLYHGSKPAGGAMQMPEHLNAQPPHWNVYFAVRDADASVAQVAALGGKIVSPAFDTPFGRVAFVADPFEAAFCLLQPSRPA
jgi:uncharacterized protein